MGRRCGTFRTFDVVRGIAPDLGALVGAHPRAHACVLGYGARVTAAPAPHARERAPAPSRLGKREARARSRGPARERRGTTESSASGTRPACGRSWRGEPRGLRSTDGGFPSGMYLFISPGQQNVKNFVRWIPRQRGRTKGLGGSESAAEPGRCRRAGISLGQPNPRQPRRHARLRRMRARLPGRSGGTARRSGRRELARATVHPSHGSNPVVRAIGVKTP